MAEIPQHINGALKTLSFQLLTPNEVGIPAGIPVSWLTNLPLKLRIRNALSRYFWPHKLVVKEPLRCAELVAIPDIGKNALHELLCVLESAELGKNQDGVRIAPSARESSTLIVGRETRDLSGVISPSERRSQEKDETEHGGIQPGNTDSPSVPEMTARILGREKRRQSGERAAREKRSQDKDETEHGGIQPGSTDSPSVDETTARILGQEERRQSRGRATPDKRSREKVEKVRSGTKSIDIVLPKEHEINVRTKDSAFQKAVNEAASQAIRVGLLRFDSSESLPTVIDRESEVVCTVSALGDLLRQFANWALAETDAQTIGEAISQSAFRTEFSEEWQAIAELSLSQAGLKPKHPYTVLESWVDNLPAREQHIFNTRLSNFEDIPTLQDLGAYFGLTRERVRQLEKRVQRKLTIMLKRESAKPIHWRAETIKQEIGVAAPFATVERLLSALNGKIDFRRIVLELAGPYELINGWLVLKSAVASDPTRRIREMTDEVGYIDHDQATKELNKWGLDTSLHEQWLVRDGKIRKLGDSLVRWDGSIGDKLVIALADIGRPATIEDLLEYIQENRAKTSAANALSIDPRAMKASQKEWALASWGLTEYSSIAMSIRDFLKSQEHPTSIENVVTGLMKDLGLKESSIRAYCQAPMFIIENGEIRLRRDDEPYTYDNVSTKNARGVFDLGSHRVSILFEVDGELLRGSGRSLALAAGFLLGVTLNRPLTFNDQDGLSVTFTYPETSISGPSVGSLRPFAEASGAKLGDLLTLTLDKSGKSVTAVATDLAQQESGWQLVSRLTGIDADEGLEGLASALHCSKGEVRAMLAKRGDEVVKDALPSRQVSSELDQALATLEAQLQRTGGSLR